MVLGGSHGCSVRNMPSDRTIDGLSQSKCDGQSLFVCNLPCPFQPAFITGYFTHVEKRIGDLRQALCQGLRVCCCQLRSELWLCLSQCVLKMIIFIEGGTSKIGGLPPSPDTGNYPHRAFPDDCSKATALSLFLLMFDVQLKFMCGLPDTHFMLASWRCSARTSVCLPHVPLGVPLRRPLIPF